MESKMTAVITFKNEYEEVEKTVCSIRSTTTNMPIILVNDGSEGEFDYKSVAEKYDCVYLHNEVSSGVAGSRMDGVKLVKTPYFIILDAHMRMYEKDWDKRAVQIMEENGTDNVYFGRTLELKDNYEEWTLEDAKNRLLKTYGCCITHEKYTLIPKWVYKPDFLNEEDNLAQVPCLMGACYMCSVENWNKLKMLEGLICWGQDEPLISLKTFLSGNKVLLIKDMIFGHLYRKSRPYQVLNQEMTSNYLYCNYLFARDDKEFSNFNYFIKKNIGTSLYKCVEAEFNKRLETIIEMKEYLYSNVFVKTMDEFYDFNNNFYPTVSQPLFDDYESTILENM